MNATAKTQAIVGAGILLALLVAPAPLLPPHRLAETVASTLGIGWKAAYLASVICLQVGFYGSLGALAAFAVPQASSRRGQLIRFVFTPALVVIGAVLIRSARLGHIPLLANALVPIIACLLGVRLGLLFRQHGWQMTIFAAAIALAALAWFLLPGVSSGLSRKTEAQLRRLVANSATIPPDEGRFVALLQTTFAHLPGSSTPVNPIENNRAAILALGIAIGHERLARFAGLDSQSGLVREAITLRQRTTLGGREDWSRHFCLSAALAVLEHPFVSEAGGLMKEQLDALSHGSGFSFGDLAADGAGVRFATAATHSEEAAKAMQARLQKGFATDDFFPPAADLPENLTVEQFRRDYGGVGSLRYRQKVGEIEARLDRCAALSPSSYNP